MRRAVLTLGGTAAGLAALLSFKTHPATLSASDAPAVPAAGGSSASSAAGGGGTQANSASNASKKSAAHKASSPQSGSQKPSTQQSQQSQQSQSTSRKPASKPSPSASAAPAARTLVGAVENTQYGPMQVEVVMTGTKITNVKVLQETNLGSRSQQIDATAVPKLNSETLAAQSAQIDSVSGATYTSEGYKQSLQSALDKA